MHNYGQNPGTYYYVNDHLGTPQQLITATGLVVWQAAYLPYGEAQVRINLVENNLRFPGQYFDAETGLHYNWNRYYDAQTGRYISADPIGLEGGMNMYAYVNGNPVNYTDYTGLAWDDSIRRGTPAYNAITGLGDGIISTLSFGFLSGDQLRGYTGLSPQEAGIDKCAPSYLLGRLGGTVLTLGANAAGAIPKSLTHYTTSEGAKSIAQNGLRSSSGGISGGGVYASSTGGFPRNPLVPYKSKVPVHINDTSGYWRTVAPGTYLQPTRSGYAALAVENVIFGLLAHRGIPDECECLFE